MNLELTARERRESDGIYQAEQARRTADIALDLNLLHGAELVMRLASSIVSMHLGRKLRTGELIWDSSA